MGFQRPMSAPGYLAGDVADPYDPANYQNASTIIGRQAQVYVGKLLAANMNSTADQAIPIILPPGYTKWRFGAVHVKSASISLTTAAGGLYSAASKGGTTLIANTQVYTTLTGAAINNTGNFMVLTAITSVNNTIFDLTTIYLSLTNPQGAAATADVFILGTPFE